MELKRCKVPFPLSCFSRQVLWTLLKVVLVQLYNSTVKISAPQNAWLP